MLGYLNKSLADFYSLEPREIIKTIEVARTRLQAEHNLQYIATVNAIGACFGGKDFDYIDAFALSKDKSNNETYTDDEVEYLKNNF
jgi:hypothetical protein